MSLVCMLCMETLHYSLFVLIWSTGGQIKGHYGRSLVVTSIEYVSAFDQMNAQCAQLLAQTESLLVASHCRETTKN